MPKGRRKTTVQANVDRLEEVLASADGETIDLSDAVIVQMAPEERNDTERDDDVGSLRTQLAQLQEQLAAERKAREDEAVKRAKEDHARQLAAIGAEATEFVRLASDKDAPKIVPAQNDPWAALYTRLATDDLEHPLETGKRTELARTVMEQTPSHRLGDTIPTKQLPPGAVALVNKQGTGADDQESDDAKNAKHRERLMATEAGRAKLRREAAATAKR